MPAKAQSFIMAHYRIFLAACCGIAASIILPPELSGIKRGIIAWDSSLGVFLCLNLLLFATIRQSHIEHIAKAQEDGEWIIFGVTVAGIAFSFIALLNEFSGSKDLPPAQRNGHIGIVVITLLLSWLSTHMIFAVRYAHEFYTRAKNRGDFDRGLKFPEEPEPDYWDFLYFSLVLGMTFQVSDVEVTSRKLRRLATAHGLMSFLFNTLIIALTVNIAAGLF